MALLWPPRALSCSHLSKLGLKTGSTRLGHQGAHKFLKTAHNYSGSQALITLNPAKSGLFYFPEGSPVPSLAFCFPQETLKRRKLAYTVHYTSILEATFGTRRGLCGLCTYAVTDPHKPSSLKATSGWLTS